MKKIIILFLFCFSIIVAQETKEQKEVRSTETQSTQKVSFKKDVMSVFTKKCLSCHNTEDEGPSGLYLDDYEELMKGDSRHGPVVKPKKGEESILIQKLRGTSTFGRQMPRGRKPLDDEIINLISRWIDQGAKNN